MSKTVLTNEEKAAMNLYWHYVRKGDEAKAKVAHDYCVSMGATPFPGLYDDQIDDTAARVG